MSFRNVSLTIRSTKASAFGPVHSQSSAFVRFCRLTPFSLAHALKELPRKTREARTAFNVAGQGVGLGNVIRAVRMVYMQTMQTAYRHVNGVSMDQEPESVIAGLKHMMGVSSDADLARALRIDKSTISSWKTRGRVPVRFQNILKGESSLALGAPPMHWAPHENAALAVALFRYGRAFGQELGSGDFETVMRLVGHPQDIWSLYREAQSDLRRAMEEEQHQLMSAASIIVHRDLEAGQAAVSRDRQIIERGRSMAEWTDGRFTTPSGHPPKLP